MTTEITDAQVHLCHPNTPERPWPSPYDIKPHREQPYMCEDLLAEMKAAGVHRAIIVPPSWEGFYNDRAIEAAQLHPGRFAVMGRFSLDAPENRVKVATWKQQPGMLGVRLTFYSAKERQWLSDGTADWFWPAAEKADLGVMIYTPGNLPPVKKIAEQYPDLKLIIDHMGIPRGTKEDAAFAHISELCELARLPNVAIKASGLPCYSNEPYPHTNLHQYVERAYDAFGRERLFWGSDLTRVQYCHPQYSYSRCMTMFTEEMKWLSDTDLKWVMGRGVCEWLGWPM